MKNSILPLKDRLLCILGSSELRTMLQGALMVPQTTVEQAINAVTGPDLISTKIIKTSLSARAKNVLSDYGIKTLGDLMQVDLVRLAGWRNVGVKTVEEIRDFIQANKDHDLH